MNNKQFKLKIEISKETFEFDRFGEFYFDKVKKFLKVYFQRSNFLMAKHKLQIILYGRLYYPNFRSINEIYKYYVRIK